MIFRNKKNKNIRELTIGLRTQLCKECKDFQTRLCLVDGKPCIFHRWVDDDQVLVNYNAPSHEDAEKMIQQFSAGKVAGPNISTEVVRRTFALVEYPDGSVGKVAPELITFLDKEDKHGAKML